MTVTALAAAAEGPELSVDAPADGLWMRDMSVPVEGHTEPSTKVSVHTRSPRSEYVNGTTSGPDGTFEVWTYLGWGRNLLTVEADDPISGTSKVYLNVTRDLSAPHVKLGLEFANGVPVPFNDSLGTYVVADDVVLLNGSVSDDLAPLDELIVHVNGALVDPGPDKRGRFSTMVAMEPGPNTIVVRVTDTVGNGRTKEVHVLRDVMPPALAVLHPLDGEVTNAGCYPVEGLTDANTYVGVRLQSPAGDRSYTTTSGKGGKFHVTVDLFEGSQLLTVTALDPLGNRNVTVLMVALDTSPPEVTILDPPGGGTVTRHTSYVITGTFDDDHATAVTVDGKAPEGTGMFRSEVALREGENLFVVRAVDVAGNERVTTVTIVRDTVAPTMTVTSPQYPQVLTRVPEVTFAGTVKGAEAVTITSGATEHRAEIVSGTWEDGTWELVLELTKYDLEQDVVVSARDRAANRASTTIHLVLDMVPPDLHIDGGPVQFTNRAGLRLTGTTEEGVGEITIGDGTHPVDDGVFNVLLLLRQGLNEIPISVRDRAGNTANETLHLTYDPVVPRLELDYPETTTDAVITVRGRTDPDVVRVYVDGQAYLVDNGTFRFTVELVGEGEHEMNFTVEDAAGNTRTEIIRIDYSTSIPGFGAVAVLASIGTLAAWRRVFPPRES